MKHYKYIVIGAGISGLAFADKLNDENLIVIEAESEIGGYCKTIKKNGFIWDYSGHFFHFQHPEIESELISKMPEPDVAVVSKVSNIFWGNKWIDFPFQKNIHQLPQNEFIDCLHDLHFREKQNPNNFKEMLKARFGNGIADKFLIPYNEKLYAIDLTLLDVDAMGRFFPYAEENEIIANFKSDNNKSYNSNFTYPRGGAIQYVRALASGVDQEKILLNQPVIAVDVLNKIVSTPSQKFSFDLLINTAPFPRLLNWSGLSTQSNFTSNRVLVFNLGFDSKGPSGVHWSYFPQREIIFYRIGFYDNIFNTQRMSLYVEIGLPSGPSLTDKEIGSYKDRVLKDLRMVGVLSDQILIEEHFVIMDPAYVHLTKAAIDETKSLKRRLAAQNIYSIGRYGGWTYCSIEDNIVEARELADTLRW